MPSFDIISEYDSHEVNNALDQANKEVTTRFDFKGIDAHFKRKEDDITLTAEVEFQLEQMSIILQNKLVKRGVDLTCMEIKKPQFRGKIAYQVATLKQGIETLLAKKIVKLIKAKKLKVQAAIQGEKVRVTGKKRDDLQQVMAMLKAETFEVPLQFDNFRD
ncbi:MAG: YajQ family cyclic di-GMP-binding protein [Methylococcales bacterium]|nr:YajQ family cyclic di-GMP-binding protein [Methylococcales bacterium]